MDLEAFSRTISFLLQFFQLFSNHRKVAIHIYPNDRVSLLVTVARMYYEHHYNQMTIAQKLDLSRPYVSKLLQEASSTGIVNITIQDPLNYESPLEQKIRMQYGLQRVFITPSIPGEDTLDQVAGSAARYLNSIVKDGDIIGIANGNTMYYFARNMIHRDDLKQIRLVQLCGEYINLSHHIFTKENMKLSSEALNATPYAFPCPMFLESVSIKKAILKEKNLRQVVQLQNDANIAVFSVGSLGSVGTNSLVKSGYLTSEVMETMMRSGAVGDIFSHFIDKNGQCCDNELDARNVSLPLAALRQKDHRICLASGRAKLEILRAALAGKYITALAIDEELGKGLLTRE